MVYLGSKFNQETVKKIVDAGFSRVPVAFSQEHPVVIGVLLVKTVLAQEYTESTIGDLYMKGKINLKVPSYFTQEANLSKVSKEFNEGRSHMGIVCETNEVALFIRDFSDYVHTQIRVEGKQPELKDFSNK